jgi:hypothetical protein
LLERKRARFQRSKDLHTARVSASLVVAAVTTMVSTTALGPAEEITPHAVPVSDTAERDAAEALFSARAQDVASRTYVRATTGDVSDVLVPAEELLVVDAVPAPLTARDHLEIQAAAAQADEARLSQYAQWLAGFSNGRIPLDRMTPLTWAPGHMLRPDAAAQLERLNIAYRAEFGVDLLVTDTYRSFDAQVALRARRPRMSATPGTSNHGWGIAVDFGGGINSFGTPQHQWMRAHAHRFGWELPAWARENGSLPEPWHWEFGEPPSSYGD